MLWEAGVRQGWGLGGGQGLFLGPTVWEKVLGVVAGQRGRVLRLNAAGGAQVCLCSWRSEDQVQDPSRLTGPEWVGEMLGVFPPDPPIPERPSPLASLHLLSFPSFLGP